MTFLAQSVVASPPTLLVATNNRFWRCRIGSHMRINALLRHFVQTGWVVQVLFQGRPYEDDETVAAAGAVHVQFSRCADALEGNAALNAPRAVASIARMQWLAAASRWLRALVTQFGRGGRGGPMWREVKLRAGEPTVRRSHDGGFAVEFERVLDEFRPSAVLVEYLFMAWLAPLAGAPPQSGPRRVPWLIDTHDVMHQRQQRFHALGEPHVLDVSAAEEAAWLSQFDAVLAIQARDAETFAANGVSAPLLTVVHPCDARQVNGPAGPPVGVGFIGSDMSPNRFAALELIEAIWPAVRAAVGGDAELVIAGAVCAALPVPAASAGVRLLGPVRDMDEFYAAVDIVVSPIRIGGGLKIKNVEALCRGKALVTTAIGAEGLEAAAGDAFLVSETAGDTARIVAALIRDAPHREALGRAALSFGATTFNTTSAFAPLDAFLHMAMAR